MRLLLVAVVAAIATALLLACSGSSDTTGLRLGAPASSSSSATSSASSTSSSGAGGTGGGASSSSSTSTSSSSSSSSASSSSSGGGCVQNGASCDDGDPCTSMGICKAGFCMKGSPIDCSAFETVCSVGVCDPALGCGAAPANEGASCDDGDACTILEVCAGGKCAQGLPIDCTAFDNKCGKGICSPALHVCVSIPCP